MHLGKAADDEAYGALLYIALAGYLGVALLRIVRGDKQAAAGSAA